MAPFVMIVIANPMPRPSVQAKRLGEAETRETGRPDRIRSTLGATAVRRSGSLGADRVGAQRWRSRPVRPPPVVLIPSPSRAVGCSLGSRPSVLCYAAKPARAWVTPR
jgi:hypothetical protein